jgi:hypothetical protein
LQEAKFTRFFNGAAEALFRRSGDRTTSSRSHCPMNELQFRTPINRYSVERDAVEAAAFDHPSFTRKDRVAFRISETLSRSKDLSALPALGRRRTNTIGERPATRCWTMT